MSVFSDFFKGIEYFFKGFSFLSKEKLWHYVLYPLILWIVIFLATLFLVGELIEQITRQLENFLTTLTVDGFEYLLFFKKGFIIKALSFLVSVFLKLAFFFIGGTLVKYITLILLSPMLSRLSEVIESKITGKKFDFSLGQFLKDVLRGISISLRNMFFEYLFIIGGFVVCFFFPPLIFVITPVLFFVSCYYYGCTMMDYSCERHKMSISQSLSFVRKHKAIVAGIGCCFALCLKIPTLFGDLAGLMIGPAVACVGATLAFNKIKEEKSAEVKISIVNYTNTLPFKYGIMQSELKDKIDLQFDIPSVCAQKLLENKVDIGLIPVAVIPLLKEHYIISKYCLGCNGKVDTVKLYSHVPLEKIEQIYLDYQSRTSVTLVQVLAKFFWKVNPVFTQAADGFEKLVSGNTAVVVIGDRCFDMNGSFEFEYDLALEWKKHTDLPFVFAAWVSNKKIDEAFISEFEKALASGIALTNEAVETSIAKEKQSLVKTYLTERISYDLNAEKKKALEYFLHLLKQL
jgi:chorismate dehydratase